MDLSKGIGAEVNEMLSRETLRVGQSNTVAEQERIRKAETLRQREAVNAYLNFPSKMIYRLRNRNSLYISDLTPDELERRKVRDYPLVIEAEDNQQGIIGLRLRTAVIESNYRLSIVAIAANGASIVRDLCELKTDRLKDSDGIMVDDSEQGGLSLPQENERLEIRSIIVEACRLQGIVDRIYKDLDPRLDIFE